MKPRLTSIRPAMLVVIALYLLAGLSLIKLLPWFESLAAGRIERQANAASGAGDAVENPAQASRFVNPFSEINFNDHKNAIDIIITTPASKEAIEIHFLTGPTCQYDDHRACAHVYQTDNGQPVIFLTIHSGMDGEAERLRHYLEGTGINRAGYSLKQARAAMTSLRGARVTIRQQDKEVSELKLSAVGRVPPAALKAYLNAPYERALNQAAAADASLQKFVYPDKPLIVLETCGWRMPGEKSSAAASDTTGSVYLAVIESK